MFPDLLNLGYVELEVESMSVFDESFVDCNEYVNFLEDKETIEKITDAVYEYKKRKNI